MSHKPGRLILLAAALTVLVSYDAKKEPAESVTTRPPEPTAEEKGHDQVVAHYQYLRQFSAYLTYCNDKGIIQQVPAWIEQASQGVEQYAKSNGITDNDRNLVGKRLAGDLNRAVGAGFFTGYNCDKTARNFAKRVNEGF